MNKLILGTFFALCCLTAVRGLKCNVCNLKVGIFCIQGSDTKDCAGKCETKTASILSASLFKKLECSSNCIEGTGNDTTFGFAYKTSCCTTDLCNAASAAKLSPLLGFALVSIWLTKFV